MYNGYDELYMGNYGNWYTGFKFDDIGVPKGVTITRAYIQFTAYRADYDQTVLTIRGEDNDDASSFSTSRGNITSRPLTTASATWNVSSWQNSGDKGTAQQTPDLKTIVQEIINRSDWDENDEMAFIFEGSGFRNVTSYEGNPNDAATLYIEWE